MIRMITWAKVKPSFITPPNDPFHSCYAHYYAQHGRECPKNHRQLKQEGIRPDDERIGSDDLISMS